MEKRNKKHTHIVYVGFAFKHHITGHGGYHHVADSGLYDYIIDCQSNYERQFSQKCGILSKLWHRIMLRIFGFEAFPLYFFKCLIYAITHKNVIFHLIYGDNLYIPLFRTVRCFSKVVCTFHQPYSFFESGSWQNRLHHLDGIILVSESELELFKDASSNNNVVYIPHGVYTDFFRPSSEVSKSKSILTVGNWLRDYEFANGVYKKFLSSNPDWEVHVVASDINLKRVSDGDRIIKHRGISDEELLNLYRKSSILFLPLLRYTANNALLEAAAAGCNVLIACNHSDNSYIPEQFISIVEMKEDLVLSQMRPIGNRQYNYALSQYVSAHYSWSVVSERTINYINSIS